MSIRKNSEDVSEKNDDNEAELLEIIDEDYKSEYKKLGQDETDQSKDYEKYISTVQDTYNQITTYCNNQGLFICENLNSSSLEEFFNTMYSSYT
jgi:hypothetical protein